MASPASPVRRPFPTSVILVFLLGAAVMVPAVYSWRRPAPPKDSRELAVRIKAAHPQWHLIPVRHEQDWTPGFWVCTDCQSFDEIAQLRLVRDREEGEHWHGIVFCHRSVQPLEINGGVYGARRGNFNLFGDPHMLPLILELLE
jgi:hypothetical protein